MKPAGHQCLLSLALLGVSCSGIGQITVPLSDPELAVDSAVFTDLPMIFDPGLERTAPTLTFSNVTVRAGLNVRHEIQGEQTSDPERIVAGVAAGDYDNDGFVDLYLVGGNGATANQLFRSLGNGQLAFEEVGAQAGVRLEGARSSGPLFADLDGDNQLDLLVGAIENEPVRVFRGLKNGTFSAVPDDGGFASVSRKNTFSGALADYDGDGDLDVAFSHWDWAPDRTEFPPIEQPQTLWANNGLGQFSDASVDSGLAELIGADGRDYSFTPNFADINNDGWPDLLMASDFATSQVFLNTQDGRFAETTDSVISDENGMGAAVADYDNDGDLDWFVSAIATEATVSPSGFSGNRLYQNNGNGQFTDVTDAAGVRIGGWGWGACFADFNNDGFVDLFHVSGWADDRFSGGLSRLFLSDGEGGFSDVTLAVGIFSDREGRGVVCADLDRDGDIDLLIANNNQFAELYQNNLDYGHNWLTVQLRSAGPNTRGIGAKVWLTTPAGTQLRVISAGNNFVSQNPAEAHFGLGGQQAIVSLRVEWPDGGVSEQQNIAVNQLLVVYNNP